MSATEYPLLVLIDFENLIICLPDAENVRRTSLEGALEKLCGLPLTVKLSPSYTDYSVLVEALTQFGLDEQFLSPSTYKAIEEEIVRNAYKQLPEDLEDCICPGITALLNECSSDGFAIPAPISNSLRGFVSLLVERSGLESQLRLDAGSCSAWRHVRTDLQRLARERAGLSGAPWPAERTVILTSLADDITAARRSGLRSIFVGDALEFPQAAVSADMVVAETHEAVAVLRGWSAPGETS